MRRTSTFWCVLVADVPWLTPQMLSDDWTKSLHLQSDRSLQLHAQGGTHATVRLPRFGRALGYHFPSADALVGAVGNEVYRLNLDQGRYLAPFQLGSRGNKVFGCNAVDVNPAHGLVSLGTEGSGVVELWDPRMRTQAGALSATTPTVMDAALMAARRQLPGVYDGVDGDADEEAVSRASQSLAITALASAEDGLNLAAGTSTGHVLLYDLRMARPYMTKDQGFGLPVHSLSWPGDNASMAAAGNAGAGSRTRSEAEDKVLSADAKVVKIWDQHSGENLVSIAPPGPLTNLNHVHHYPGTGLIFAAVEGTQMDAWYVPALGPAPRWCSFLDNLTDEMDGTEGTGTGGVANAYEDFKFVDQNELERLELTHLVGTSLLRPYMHGYFISLGLYEKARLIAHPTAYAEARQRAIEARLAREAESRVRSNAEKPKIGKNVRVNRELAEKLATKRAPRAGSDEEEEASTPAADAGPSGLLHDPRFQELFTNPEFQVDENSREFALLNPSAALKPKPAPVGDMWPTYIPLTMQREGQRQLVPAAEEELEESDESLDPDQEELAGSESEPESEDRAPSPPPTRAPPKKPKRVPQLLDEHGEAMDSGGTLGERVRKQKTHEKRTAQKDSGTAGSTSLTWTPSSRGDAGKPGKAPKKREQETFGAGLSKGAGAEEGYGVEALSDEARFGRKKRRHPGRSASRNAMRASTK